MFGDAIDGSSDGSGGSGPRATIRDYYRDLRNGEPLGPYFADEAGTVKFGVREALFGGEAVAAGLADQTRTTSDWSVGSRRLSVTVEGDHAWFADVVDLAWTDDGSGDRRSFETRWSGSLRRRDGAWQFLGMHVSAPVDLAGGSATGIDGERLPAEPTEADGGDR